MKDTKQMSETFLLGGLLATTGGFLDAYTYMSRGHVFANAQTGNIVLLGINIAEGNFREASYYSIPIVAFIVGIIISEIVKKRYKAKKGIHWRQIVIIVEVVVLMIVANIPDGRWNMVANILVSLVCSMQVQSFRKFNGNAFATTMCTGNLRSGTEQMIRYVQTKDRLVLERSMRYYGIIIFFIIGAGMGVLVTNRLGTYSVLSCCMILMVVFGMMFIKNE